MEATLQTRAKSTKSAIRSCYQSRTAEINGDLRAAAETNRYLQLPEEVLEDILLRLPAETLKNCKRVCKSLFDLINNPSFVNKHLLRVTTENRKPCSSSSRTLFLKWIRQELSMDDIFDGYDVYHLHGNDLSKLVLSMVTICEEDDTNGNRDDDRLSCVVEEVRLPPIPESELPYFPTYIKASSHSNGIIHMADPENEGTSVLLNPILGEFKLLIRPEDLPDDYYSKFTGDDLTLHGLAGWGFGYDPKAKVYKCVKIYVDECSKFPVALVYTLGRYDSSRMIKIDIGGHRCSFQSNGVYCKGAYHWLNAGGQMILSFDMSEEKFYRTRLPKDLYAKVKKLQVWKESLIIFYGLECSWFSSIFEMWVMVGNIGGVEGSTYWTKHLTIGPLVCIFYPLIFWKDDELLLEGQDGRIVSYNLDTKRLRTLPLPGAVYPGHTSAYLYLKSLVSL